MPRHVRRHSLDTAWPCLVFIVFIGLEIVYLLVVLP